MMNKEIWKDIEGYEGLYQVSNLGRVRSLDRVETNSIGVSRKLKGRILKRYPNKDGYLQVSLLRYMVRKIPKVHRLVANEFILNPANKPQVNHIDGDKANNNVSNLEWNTIKENNIHALKTGLRIMPKGGDCYCAKLTWKEVKEIRAKYIPEKYSQQKLSEEYGVTDVTISNIINNKTWIE